MNLLHKAILGAGAGAFAGAVAGDGGIGDMIGGAAFGLGFAGAGAKIASRNGFGKLARWAGETAGYKGIASVAAHRAKVPVAGKFGGTTFTNKSPSMGVSMSSNSRAFGRMMDSSRNRGALWAGGGMLGGAAFGMTFGHMGNNKRQGFNAHRGNGF